MLQMFLILGVTGDFCPVFFLRLKYEFEFYAALEMHACI